MTKHAHAQTNCTYVGCNILAYAPCKNSPTTSRLSISHDYMKQVDMHLKVSNFNIYVQLVDRSTGLNVVFYGRQVDRYKICISRSTGRQVRMLYFLVDRSTGLNVVSYGRQVDRYNICISWSTGRQVRMLYFLVDRSTGLNVVSYGRQVDRSTGITFVFLGRQVDRFECCISWSTGITFVFLGRQVDRFECCISWSTGRQV